MPGMPRIPGKAKKIAYAILGVPGNMHKPTKKEQKLNTRLIFEETTRVR